MRRGFTAIVLVLGVALPTSAFAFVQTMTCSPDGGVFACESGETPKPVQWAATCVHYYINETGTTDIGGGTEVDARTLAAVQSSFTTWSAVGQSELVLEYGGLTNEDRAEYIGERGSESNANVVIWRDEEWPYASRTAFAITSVTYNPSTGVIADADIELNGENHTFTVEDDQVRVDVRNTLTHEVGHFLGLDHTSVQDATMFGSAPQGETQKRTLHADDIAGLVSIYPSQGTNVLCEEKPAYFERPIDKEEKGCCTTVGGNSAPRGGLALSLLLGFVVMLRKRSREL